MLKHGSNEQRDLALLLLAKEDLFALASSRYGSYVVEKAFKYASKGKAFSFFRDFFK